MNPNITDDFGRLFCHCRIDIEFFNGSSVHFTDITIKNKINYLNFIRIMLNLAQNPKNKKYI